MKFKLCNLIQSYVYIIVTFLAFTIPLYAQVDVSDSLALVDFYNSTEGLNWNLSESALEWRSSGGEGASFENFGDVSNRNYRLVSLRVSGISGTIPESIGNCTELKEIDIRDGELSGSLPESIVNLKNLEQLFITKNQLSGSLPAAIGNLINLRDIYFSENQLSGEIPNSIGNLTSLVRLDLTNNQISGKIPEELANLTSLHTLRLGNNQLKGQIPDIFAEMNELYDLSLYQNRFEGLIPRNIFNLESLSTLHISYNNFSDTLPKEIGHLVNLTFLHAYGCNLSGRIPEAFKHLTKISILGLGGNSIGGELPDYFTSFKNLRMINLNDNNFEGPLPPGLGNLNNLNEVGFQFNNFSGCYPEDYKKFCSNPSPPFVGNPLLDNFDLFCNAEILPCQCDPDLFTGVEYIETIEDVSNSCLHKFKFFANIDNGDTFNLIYTDSENNEGSVPFHGAGIMEEYNVSINATVCADNTELTYDFSFSYTNGEGVQDTCPSTKLAFKVNDKTGKIYLSNVDFTDGQFSYFPISNVKLDISNANSSTEFEIIDFNEKGIAEIQESNQYDTSKIEVFIASNQLRNNSPSYLFQETGHFPELKDRNIMIPDLILSNTEDFDNILTDRYSDWSRFIDLTHFRSLFLNLKGNEKSDSILTDKLARIYVVNIGALTFDEYAKLISNAAIITFNNLFYKHFEILDASNGLFESKKLGSANESFSKAFFENIQDFLSGENRSLILKKSLNSNFFVNQQADNYYQIYNRSINNYLRDSIRAINVSSNLISSESIQGTAENVYLKTVDYAEESNSLLKQYSQYANAVIQKAYSFNNFSIDGFSEATTFSSLFNNISLFDKALNGLGQSFVMGEVFGLTTETRESFKDLTNLAVYPLTYDYDNRIFYRNNSGNFLDTILLDSIDFYKEQFFNLLSIIEEILINEESQDLENHISSLFLKYENLDEKLRLVSTALISSNNIERAIKVEVDSLERQFKAEQFAFISNIFAEIENISFNNEMILHSIENVKSSLNKHILYLEENVSPLTKWSSDYLLAFEKIHSENPINSKTYRLWNLGNTDAIKGEINIEFDSLKIDLFPAHSTTFDTLCPGEFIEFNLNYLPKGDTIYQDLNYYFLSTGDKNNDAKRLDGVFMNNDLDNDGFIFKNDCDDKNASINPNASEVHYNGTDDDCDPATLDDDLDKDGFGIDEDCDDENASINPEAEDIPNNGIDENCDGVDEISTSISEETDSKISIFPNPSENIIFIQNVNFSYYHISLLNSSSQQVFDCNSCNEIEVSKIPKGIYIIKIADENSQLIHIERIIIHR